MSEAIDSKEILHELKAIREDLDYIKGHGRHRLNSNRRGLSFFAGIQKRKSLWHTYFS